VIFIPIYADETLTSHDVSSSQSNFFQKPFTLNTLAELAKEIPNKFSSYPDEGKTALDLDSTAGLTKLSGICPWSTLATSPAARSSSSRTAS